MILLVRTDENGFIIDKPRQITKKNIPQQGSSFYCTEQQRIYQHLANYSYSAESKDALFKLGIVNAVYTIKD